MFRHHFFLRNAANRGRNTRRFFADDSDMDPKGRDLELAYPLVNIYITIMENHHAMNGKINELNCNFQ